MKEESGLVPEKRRVRRCRGKGLAEEGWRTYWRLALSKEVWELSELSPWEERRPGGAQQAGIPLLPLAGSVAGGELSFLFWGLFSSTEMNASME